MRIFKNTLLALATGYIFVYFSEHLFWARPRPEDSLGEWVSTWIAYSLLAFLFLSIVAYFRIKNIWALFLAGAALGWLAEGVLVQTTYESLPLSISFTGLAWHALITVWIGWYALQRSLLSSDRFRTLKLSTVIGLCYGLWSIAWWLEPDGGISTLTEFAGFSLTTTILLIVAYWMANWSASEPFTPNRWVAIFVSALFSLYFLFVAVPAAPLAMVILPMLLGSIYVVLRRSRLKEADGSLIGQLRGRIPLWNIGSLLAIPLVSTLVYGLALSRNVQWQTNWILYLIATPLGFILFGISVHHAWRNNPALDTPPDSQIIQGNRRPYKDFDRGK